MTVRLQVIGSISTLGGAFTHLTSVAPPSVYAPQRCPLDLSGKPDHSWSPEFNGSVIDIDVVENDSLLPAAGHFTRATSLPKMLPVGHRGEPISTSPGPSALLLHRQVPAGCHRR